MDARVALTATQKRGRGAVARLDPFGFAQGKLFGREKRRPQDDNLAQPAFAAATSCNKSDACQSAP